MARTVGFSLGEEDEARLDRLLGRREPGNRSRFLREALEVMERYDRVRDLEALQSYGELKAVQARVDPSEIPDLVARVAALDDQGLRQRADQLLNDLRYLPVDGLPSRTDPLPAARSFVDALADAAAPQDGGMQEPPKQDNVT